MCIAIPFAFQQRKSELSLINPSGFPKKLMPSTVLHSVIYVLPNGNGSIQDTFLRTLGYTFPEGQALGLFTKVFQGYYIVEMVLSSDKEYESALKVPVSFEHELKRFSYYAIPTAHPSLDLFRVDLTKIPLQSFDTLKTVLIKVFSKYGTVLDIVLSREGPSHFWFMGNGYILISRKKNVYNRNEDPPCIDLGFPYFEATELKWSKVR